ncbi:MAG: YdeI/OmpD-associated family protein [Chitinivibrionales bacterium]
MTNYRTLRVADRKEWRAWLEKNFDKEREIWLVLPKKSSGQKRILYNDSVEEALCFGWIDSTVRKLDNSNAIQRFTPRNPKSGYSQSNKERLQLLLKQGLLHPSIAETSQKVLKEKFVFPADILAALRKDATAWRKYTSFSESYKRIRVAYIDGARKRPDKFKKRLASFIDKTRKNKLIGYGGIEKYY